MIGEGEIEREGGRRDSEVRNIRLTPASSLIIWEEWKYYNIFVIFGQNLRWNEKFGGNLLADKYTYYTDAYYLKF